MCLQEWQRDKQSRVPCSGHQHRRSARTAGDGACQGSCRLESVHHSV